MIRDEFRALTPWSFFLPIALAVMLGVLVAHALIAAFSGSGGDADASAAQLAALTADAGEPQADSSNASSATGRKGRSAVAKTVAVLAPVSLPGPSSARRDGEARACIGGTIAMRAENGWEQEVVEDAPARCTASSR
jgi:hypothetical protein